MLPNKASEVIYDVIDGTRNSIPTEELKEFSNAVEAYVEKVHVHISESTYVCSRILRFVLITVPV